MIWGVRVCVLPELIRQFIDKFLHTLLWLTHGDSLPMRLYCEFNNCPCAGHVGPFDSKCGACNHGACWHKNGPPHGFRSLRAMAHSPSYSSTIPFKKKDNAVTQVAQEVRCFLPVAPNQPMPIYFAHCFCEEYVCLPVWLDTSVFVDCNRQSIDLIAPHVRHDGR